MLKSAFVASLFGMATTVIMAPPAAPGAGTERVLFGWMPDAAQCDGTPVGHLVVRRPWGSLSYGLPKTPPSLTYAFEIDATGRPLSITREGEGFVSFGGDVAPALAASRFAPGVRKNCRITYTADAKTLTAAAVADLVSYTITPTSGPLPKAGWDRIKGTGDCATAPVPQPLLRAFPDFGTIEGTPGVKDWSLVTYDTDENGTPVKMRTVMGTGNAALDSAARKAVGGSRFTQGARTGCLYPYWKAPETLAPPPTPQETAFRPAASNCAEQTRWQKPLALRFPDPWLRRSIEGWAIVTYDIAPWGAVGNAKVVAAQPAAEFGQQALAILQNASAEPSAQGSTGCVETIRFAIGQKNSSSSVETPDGQGIF